MVQHLKMTVLVDNIAKPPCRAEWGLSILIEADGKTILLDTGSSGLFAENAELLGIDLAAVEVGVLSHAHYDHADGMDTFFSRNDTARFLVRGCSRENCFGMDNGAPKYIGIRRGLMEEYRERICFTDGLYEISDGILLVPHRPADYSAIALRSDLYTCPADTACSREVLCPDDFSHEQSLVVDTEAGLVVFNSCSHTGMPNILEDVKEALGRQDVFAYVGGLHLFKLTDAEIDRLCGEIDEIGLKHIFTGHCTGDHAYQLLSGRLGDRIVQFCSGFRCKIIETGGIP